METFLLPADSKGIAKAVALMRSGEPVAFPTETVYGLGAPIFSIDTIAKIFSIKGRPKDNPLIVHISSLEQVASVANQIPDTFFILATAFFPGPLTILLPKSAQVPSIVTAGLPMIGVRMPLHPLAIELIQMLNEPIVAPSANLSGKPSSTKAQHVLDDFDGKIAGILDGGECCYGLESTVLLLTPTPLILRPGSITQEQLSDLLKMPVGYAGETQEKPLCPGMKYRHYAPMGKVILFESRDSLQEHIDKKPKVNRMVIDPPTAQDFFACFREADKMGCEEILVLCDTSALNNAALMNRLMRAANI